MVKYGIDLFAINVKEDHFIWLGFVITSNSIGLCTVVLKKTDNRLYFYWGKLMRAHNVLITSTVALLWHCS